MSRLENMNRFQQSLEEVKVNRNTNISAIPDFANHEEDEEDSQGVISNLQ